MSTIFTDFFKLIFHRFDNKYWIAKTLSSNILQYLLPSLVEYEGLWTVSICVVSGRILSWMYTYLCTHCRLRSMGMKHKINVVLVFYMTNLAEPKQMHNYSYLKISCANSQFSGDGGGCIDCLWNPKLFLATVLCSSRRVAWSGKPNHL